MQKLKIIRQACLELGLKVAIVVLGFLAFMIIALRLIGKVFQLYKLNK